jgi:hypothetical protein
MRSETSFDLDGDLIVVDALVSGPAGRASIKLVLDTGAVLTTLVPSVAQSIGYSTATSIMPTVTRTAAANEHGYLVQLSELSTLGVTEAGVHVNVADLGYDVEGGAWDELPARLQHRDSARRAADHPREDRSLSS